MKRKSYIEDEAAHSGNETSEGSDCSDNEKDDSIVCGDDEVEYEEGHEPDDDFDHRTLSNKDFKKTQHKLKKISKSSAIESTIESIESSRNESSKPKLIGSEPKVSKMPTKKDDSAAVKLISNKFLHESAIPPKPTTLGLAPVRKISSRKFSFRIFFTNGAMFYKFLLPISNAVHELRFNLTSTSEFIGLRLEAHDTYLTLANKSRFECDIEGGCSEDGVQILSDALTGLSFCVSASHFMQTLGCATLKDTVLTITRYNDTSDKIFFEANTNENDVQTLYSCDLLAESRLESLKGMQFNLGYHINLYLKTLKEQTVNAKKCGASTIYFALYQSTDKNDENIIHSKLSVGFKGSTTSGSHDFFQSAKKIEKIDNDCKVVEWEPVTSLTIQERNLITMDRCSYNEYDNSKLRLFLNHMDIEWVLIHLCNDGTQKPLVMECEIGGKNTKHTIIVAPKLDV